MTRHSIVRSLPLFGWKLLRTEKGADDVTMIGTEGPDTEVETILGVDTHLDFHVAVALIIWAEKPGASPACQRPCRVTKCSSAGLRVLAP